MKFDQLKLENQICHRLYNASNRLTRVYRPLLKEIGLTYPQYIVMMALWEHKALYMVKLSEVTSIDKGSLSVILKKMNEVGLIKIKEQKDDKRKRLITLAAKGKSIEKKASLIPSKVACEFEISIQEIQKLKDILDTINQTKV